MPGSGMVSRSLEELDSELVGRTRSSAAWRLRMGQLLEALARLEGFLQLGFSSLTAYALERCERAARWVEAARLLARRLEELPALRRSVATGQLSWSIAELVCSVATPAEEAHWLRLARSQTVRQLREHVRAARGGVSSASTGAGTAASAALPGDGCGVRNPSSAELELSPQEEHCTITCTVNTEDAWLFEATRTLLEHLGTVGDAAQIEAVLAESQDVLLSELPRGALELDAGTETGQAHRRRVEQLARRQAEAEKRSESQIRGVQPVPARLDEISAFAAAGLSSLQRRTAQELDEELRALARVVARQELDLAVLLLQFHRVNGWRSLGYASEAHYARERLGLSRSSLLSRRALALRLEALPAVAEALGSAQIGVEAARLLARIATPRTAPAWLARARQRTIKHLREEVSAALIAVRVSGEVDCPPPADAELDAYGALQRAVISGRACEPAPSRSAREQGTRPLVPPASQARRAWLVMLASLERWLAGGLMGPVRVGESAEDGIPSEGQDGNGVAPPARGKPRDEKGVQTSASGRVLRSGRVVLRWRVSRDVYHWWHTLKNGALPWLRSGVSWLRFCCLAFWQAWRHVLGAPAEYGGIYLRDGYRCRSPVCNRRDVTPHHLRFRSQGGGDEPANVASVCSWCHLFGIHGGRIRAEGTADCIRWELGPISRPCVVVHGRERVAA